MSENVNITEAKKSLKHSITFLQSLLKHVNKGEEPNLGRSVIASWCLHRYIHDQLGKDMEKAFEDVGKLLDHSVTKQ